LVGLLLCGNVLSSHGGTLTGTFSPIASGSNVDLTTSGKLDWVHWGLYTDSSVNRKASVTPSISDFSLLGDANCSNCFLAAYQYTDNANGYTWYDGAPSSNITNTTTGVWAYNYPVAGGSGFQITAPANTTQKTLQVFVGAYAAAGQLTATLSDGSAPEFVSTPNATVSNAGNGPGGVFSLAYSASSNGALLTVTWQVATIRSTSANVTLQAAALTAAGANNPPYVAITNPISNENFQEPATILVAADAKDFDGSVTNVSFYSGTNQVGQVKSSPFSFTWSNVTRGQYVLTAVATDNAGGTSSSQPVQLFVYGSGGNQTGSAAPAPALVDLTSEGTADWTHWGLVTNTSFDYKNLVQRQISNFTVLGTNIVQQFSDGLIGFSWSDGTPTPSAADTTTGVLINGLTNGFLLTAPADTNARQLNVYVEGYGGQGEFQAFLSDLSGPAYTDTSISNVFGVSQACYTLNYAAASPGQHLIVAYRLLNLFDRLYGNVSLQSAALQGGPASPPTPERVLLVNPMMVGKNFIFSFLSQSNFSYAVKTVGSLSSTNWTTLLTLPGTGAMLSVTNQNVNAGPAFYRVQTQ
jgi:hypothetical protein